MLVTDALLQREPWTLPGLTVRVRKRLEQIAYRKIEWAGCCYGMPEPHTVAVLLKWSASTLLSFPGFGSGSLDNLETVLGRHGCKLKRRRFGTLITCGGRLAT